MAARFSATGKRLGRPPKVAAAPEPMPSKQDIAIGKAALHAQARYDAAGRGRRMASWNPPASGPNEALAGLQTIRNRSRDASRNDWAGESSVQKWATNLIGIGITPRFRRIKSKTRKLALMDLWNDFVQKSDADCVLNLYGQQTLVTRSWIEAGEVFARRRARFDDEGLPVPFQVQVLEADMVPLLDTKSWKGLPEGNQIKSGIEINKRGKRVAFWVYKEHPGDNMGADIGPDALVRVPASEMVHVFEPKRPGQMRGVSPLAPTLARLRNTLDYEDATLERQKIANLWVGFISRSLPEVDPDGLATDALTGLDRALDPEGSGLVPLRPGLIQELEDGQTFNFANPPEAGTDYSDYVRTSHLGTAAAAGLPYELFSGDIREVSDRTLRVVVNDFRRFAEQRQWQIIIHQFCQPVSEWFAEGAALMGKVALTEVDDVKRVEHAPHGWAYLHPVQDVQGKAMEVTNGFRSRSSVIGERGDDPDTVDDERAADMEREETLGLPTAGVLPAAGDTQGDADGIDNEEYSAPPNPPSAAEREQEHRNNLHLATLARMAAETKALDAISARQGCTAPDPLAEGHLKLQSRILDLLGEGAPGEQP